MFLTQTFKGPIQIHNCQNSDFLIRQVLDENVPEVFLMPIAYS